MHSIDDINGIINDGKKLEEKGLYLSAYKAYLYAIRAVDNDDDSYPFAGINPAPFDQAQEYALHLKRKVWWKLTEEEKKVANNKDYSCYWRGLELIERVVSDNRQEEEQTEKKTEKKTVIEKIQNFFERYFGL